MSRIFFGDPEAIEEELRDADPSARRMIAAHVARSLVRAVEISSAETTFAIAAAVTQASRSRRRSLDLAEELARRIAVALATDRRRRQLHEALAERARESAEDLPLLSAALGGLLDEGIPRDPEDDDLWTNFAIGAAQAQGR